MRENQIDQTLSAAWDSGISRRDLIKGGLAAGALLVAGCASNPTSSTSTGIKRGGRLILGTPQPIQTLDPHAFGIYNNRNAWPGLYNGLTRYDVQLTPGPDLAKSWQTSSDGTVWTFDLVQGVKFHDGRSLTADDVKFSIERVLDPNTKAGVYAAGIQEVDRVDVVNTSRVKITLKQPSAVLLDGLARVMIVPAGTGASTANKAIGTGPYKMRDYAVNDRLVLDKFDGYWESGKPYMDGVTIQTIPDTTALFTALTSGTVAVYWQLEPKFAKQLEGNPNVRLLFAPHSSVITYLQIDNQSEPFSHVEARQALLYALDLKTINQVAFFGTGKIPPGNNLLPPGHWAEKPGLTDYAYDLSKAKQLFDSLGVKQLSYVGLNIVPWTKVIGEVLQQSLSQIGIKLNVTNPELSVWSAAFTPHPGPGTIVPNAALPDYDPAFLFDLADPAVNPWRFSNPEFAQLLAQGRKTLDQNARKQVYWNAEMIWNQQLPAPVICFDRWFHAASSYVKDLKHLNSGDLDYRETWLAK